jgi:peroxiredoxin
VEQTPVVNRLYNLVAKSDLKDKVKFIGLGESDSAAALKQFKASHKVPFPLVPDPDWAFCNAFNLEGTPTTVVVDKHGKVLLVEVGTFNSAPQFFQKLKARVK